MLHHFSCTQRWWPSQLACLLLCLVVPAICKAQGVGQVECARPGDFVYLYSSMTTLAVRATLQCGQQVEVTGRYDEYFGVRTADGQTGYVPIDFLLLLKTAPGADAQVGDEVDLEVSEDVVVDGFLVIAKGANAVGVVNEAEPKKALGRGGKLGVLVRSVRLANNQEAVLRSGGEAKGSSSTAGMVIPVMRGKDITFPKGTEITAYVNGDTRLKRENFHAAPQIPDAPRSGKVSNLPHP